jgi:hypothetical protein
METLIKITPKIDNMEITIIKIIINIMVISEIYQFIYVQNF